MRCNFLFPAAALLVGGGAHGVPVAVEMPFDGKVTVAIDRADGTRVRNLVCGRACQKGPATFDWDCKGEDGAFVEPGDYRLRVLAHPGLSYDFLGSFGNGGEKLFQPYGPNHMTFRALAARKGEICASAFFTEGGNSTVVLKNDGSLKWGVCEIWGNGNRELVHVSGDSDFFYAVREDKAGDQSQLLLFAYSWERAERPQLRLPKTGVKRAGVFRAAPLAGRKRKTLGGAAFDGGRLYVSDALAGGVSVYPLAEDAGARRATLGACEKTIPVADPGCLARLGPGKLLGANGRRLFVLDTASGTVRERGELPEVPISLAPDPNDAGFVYCLFKGGSTIARCDIATGRVLDELGEPGGAYQGPWRKDRLVEPRGLAFDSDGGLWVTEERYKPKRLTKWDVRRRTCVYEKTGSEMYGSPGAGMDEDDPRHWIAHDAEWRLGSKGAEGPVGVLHPEKPDHNGAWDIPPVAARTYRFPHQGSRTFLFGVAESTVLWELKDHRAVPLALFSAPDIYVAHLPNRTVPPAMLSAYMRDRNKKDAAKAEEALRHDSAPMFWKDLNGDGIYQAEEFSFLPKGTVAPIGGWGFFPESLDFSYPVWTGSETKVLSFRAGTIDRLPDYDLKRSWETARVNRRPMPKNQRTAQGNVFADRFGRSIFVGAGPNMLGFGADGQLAWHLRNKWVNVHGSHDAPLPKPGEMQGVLFALGAVPFSETADAMAIVGNHGRVFFVTTDGLYLDELFTDCRVSSRNDETYIGGEAFGGSFQYDRKRGRPVLQAGGGGYRCYVIKGLDRAVEKKGKLSVTAKDVALSVADEQNHVPQMKAPKIMELGDKPSTVRWQSGGRSIEVEATAEKTGMKLVYRVGDESPWVNGGTDDFLRFKTGDAVTFDFAASPGQSDRRQAQEGDMRLLAAPDASGKTQVVAYRFKTRAKNARPKSFSSPWRTYAIDDVALVPEVKTSVRRAEKSYTLTLDVPYGVLGVARPEGRDFRADFGVIFGDSEGTVNLSRSCWSNKATGLVNDVPGEIMPDPFRWGVLSFGACSRTVGANGVRFEPAGVLANPGGLLYGTDDPKVQRYSVGPAWEPKRKLLAVSSGTGCVTAMTAEGRRVATWTLPGAQPFTRFNCMAFASDGALFVLAGTEVWRIAPQTADGGTGKRLSVGGPVHGMSSCVVDGKLVLHRKTGPVLELDVASLSVREIGQFPVPGEHYNMPLIDRTPRGDVAFIRNHVDLYRLSDGKLSGPTKFFGSRELTMQHGAILGDELWALMGDTFKRYDARTMEPAPGVVFGGASGAFLGTVDHDWEMDLTGVRRIGVDLYAAASWPLGTIHVFAWNAQDGKLSKVRRFGPFKNSSGLFLDRYGAIVSYPLVWTFESAPDAPTVATHRKAKDWGMVQLPGGQVLSVMLDSSWLRFRRGRPEGKLSEDESLDVIKGIAEEERKTKTADAVLLRDGDRLTFLRVATDGRTFACELTPTGHPKMDSVRRGRLPVPAWKGKGDAVVTGVASLSDGRLLAAVHGALRTFTQQADGSFAEASKPFAAGVRAEDVSCADGLVLVADAAAGTVLAYAEDGRPAGVLKGLSEPSMVSHSNGRVVVYERAAQRLSRFRIKDK